MKRPSEYMTMTDGVTQQDYKNALNKYIDYLEAKIQALSQHDVIKNEVAVCGKCKVPSTGLDVGVGKCLNCDKEL